MDDDADVGGLDELDGDGGDGERGRRTAGRWEARSGAGIPAWAIPAALALITLGTYLPTFRNEHFLAIGDEALLNVEGRPWRGLGADNLRWMFTTRHLGQYQPVTWLSFGVDHVTWRDHPQGVHFSSLLMHLGSVLLLYAVLVRLLRAALPAGIAEPALRLCAAGGALVFAVHPLHVEAVAWAAARSDVLSGMLALLSTWLYLRYAGAARGAAAGAWLGASVLAFGAAVLAKASVLMLPAVLMVLDVFPLRRMRKDAAGRRPMGPIVDKVPFVSIALAGLYLAWEALAPLTAGVAAPAGAARVALGGYGLLFALSKTVVPLGLSPIYERPEELGPYLTKMWLCTASVALITVVTLGYARRRPAWAATWLSYVVLLLPAASVVWLMPHLWADRYNYMADAAMGALAAGGLAAWQRRWAGSRGVMAAGGVLAAGIAIAAAVGTWRQIGVWQGADSVLLCALRQNPRSWMARRELAVYYSNWAKSSRLEEAQVRDLLQRSAEQYRRLVQQRPGDVQVLVNLGTVQARLGEYGEAMQTFRRALSLDANLFEAHYNLGIHELLVQRRAETAIEHFRAAAALQPTSFETHFNLAKAYLAMKDLERAEASAGSALQLRPGSVDTAILLAEIALARGDETGARELLAAADKSEEMHASARARLNELMPKVGLMPAPADVSEGVAPLTAQPPGDPEQVAQAVERLRQTVADNPQDAGAHNDLANLLSMQGQTAEALAEYEKALELKPDFVEVYLNQAIVLRRAGRGADGAAALRKGLERLPDSAPLLWTLGWLLATHEDAALREGVEALRLAERAVELTGGANAEALVALSAAQAENGRLGEAQETAQRAAELARTQGAASLAEKATALVQYYQQGQAYHGTQ